MIGNILSSVFDFFIRLFKTLFGWIGELLGFLFQKMFDLLKLLFSPIFALIAIIFYFLFKIGQLFIKLLQVLLGIGKIFVALIKGIFATIAGFTYTPSVRSDGQWTSIFTNLNSGLADFQLDNVAYVLMFIIWFVTAWAAIQIISSMRGGG